jgi:hypothetical protein
MPDKSPKIVNPELKLSDVVNSIYSSVDKVKRTDKEKIHLATKSYKDLYVNEVIAPKEVMADLPTRPAFNRINESPQPKYGMSVERYKYDIERSPKRSNDALGRHLNKSYSSYLSSNKTD